MGQAPAGTMCFLARMSCLMGKGMILAILVPCFLMSYVD